MIPEIAPPLSYSVFKELRCLLRAPTVSPLAAQLPRLSLPSNSRISNHLPPRERPPPSSRQPAARNLLPRRKHRVLPDLAVQHPRQHPRLNLQKPPVAYTVIE